MTTASAVFSFVNAIQFKPRPVEDGATLVDLSETSLVLAAVGGAAGLLAALWVGGLHSRIGAWRYQSATLCLPLDR